MAGVSVAAPPISDLFPSQPNVDDIGPRSSLKFPGWADLVRVDKQVRTGLSEILKVVRTAPEKKRNAIYFDPIELSGELEVSEDGGFKWEKLFVVLKGETFSVWASKKDYVRRLLMSNSILSAHISQLITTSFSLS